MMNNRVDNNQCTISYKLLKLLQWLVEHEQETVKKVIAKAAQRGLNIYDDSAPSVEHFEHELQQSVVDFFALLEVLLSEVTQEEEVKQTMQRHLIPALDHIDSSLCDTATVASSVAKAASSQLKDQSTENVKQVLFKELLKRWKPAKKPYAH